MEKLILALNESLLPVAGIAFFTIIWVVVYRTLKEAQFFESKSSLTAMATCVSLLSVIGMFHFLGAGFEPNSASEKADGDGMNLDFILLPYAALGITIILLALYLFGTKLLGNGKSKYFHDHAEDRTESFFQPDPFKWDKPAGGKVEKAYKGGITMKNNSPTPQPINRLMKKHVNHSNNRKEGKQTG